MQPPFPRHQWEETVAKMVKTYGAPADEKQVHAIVDYLMAFNGTAPQVTAEAPAAGDEESAAISGAHPQPETEPAPMLAVANRAEEHAAEVKRGAALFMQDCAGCHGAEGRGDGIAGQALLHRPANLAAAQFSVRLLSQVLWNGVPGTSMPSWRSLPQSDLNALVAHVQTLHPFANPEKAAPETLARGKTLFLQDCAVCHGAIGDGKSAVAATLAPAPANLKWIRPDFDYVLQILRDGIPGTAMPSWKDQLSESDRGALAGFVRSLYESTKLNER
jgi:cytochrome c oxidase cbb3-type subunit 2/cytochrome c oxidase cbb3-type subunit I/II